VFFFYDLSPIKATFQESSSSFLQFLTVSFLQSLTPLSSRGPRRALHSAACLSSAACDGVFWVLVTSMESPDEETPGDVAGGLQGLCAIVGGVFTVAGMLDSTIYTGQKIAQKMALGKQS
jgi:hypothetical protein